MKNSSKNSRSQSFESLEHIGNSRSVISMIGKIERELVETEEKMMTKEFFGLVFSES